MRHSPALDAMQRAASEAKEFSIVAVMPRANRRRAMTRELCIAGKKVKTQIGLYLRHTKVKKSKCTQSTHMLTGAQRIWYTKATLHLGSPLYNKRRPEGCSAPRSRDQAQALTKTMAFGSMQ